MSVPKSEELLRKSCAPCEGGIPAFSADEARAFLASLPGWELADDGRRIRRHWTVKNFQAGIDFFDRIAGLAEREGHHPDLHLEAYRKVTVEIWTHSIGGLSENDFILAAKIDQIPVLLKQ